MNEYLKEFISLKEIYKLQDRDKSSVLALYQFADRLAVTDGKEAKEVLVDVYWLLGMMESAYLLFSTIVNKGDRKQIKKLATLQELSKSQADNYALPRPLTEKEEAARRERLKDLPQVLVHLKRVRKRPALAAAGKALSTILFCHIVLKMWKISALFVYQTVKQQENMMLPLFRMQSGMVSLIRKRMKSFSAVHRGI